MAKAMTEGEALVAYAALRDKFAPIDASLNELREKFEADSAQLVADRDALKTEIKTYVDAMGGLDPFGLLKSTGGHTGPRNRDARRGEAVRNAMDGTRGIKEIVAAANEALSAFDDAEPVDDGYVNGVITQLKKGAKGQGVVVEGERGSFTYRYVPAPATETPTEA